MTCHIGLTILVLMSLVFDFHTLSVILIRTQQQKSKTRFVSKKLTRDHLQIWYDKTTSFSQLLCEQVLCLGQTGRKNCQPKKMFKEP